MCNLNGIIGRIIYYIVSKDAATMSYEGVDVVVDTERFYHNKADKIATDSYLNEAKNNFSAEFLSRLNDTRNKLLNNLVIDVKKNENHMLKEDITVYTGLSGLVVLYLRIANEGDKFLYLKDIALNYVNKACKNDKYMSRIASRPTFLCGIAGPLAIKATISPELSDTSVVPDEVDSRKCVETLVQILTTVTHDDNIPNELLYGRAGYLYALLYVKNKAGNSISSVISNESIKNLALSIIDRGMKYAKQNKLSVPMWWHWHDKEYIGAAHGICGILLMLLSAREFIPEELLTSHLKPTLDYLVSLQYPSGNFPSSVSGHGMPTNDKLLHWCHGAPGVIYLLIKAHAIWPNNEDSYLKRARQCGDTIWKRGLLKKGYGICHGVSGNAYAFVALWNATHEPKYLQKVALFAEWCCEYGKRGCRVPDRPLSLFEGVAGVIYLLTDLIQDPSLSKFPAFSDL